MNKVLFPKKDYVKELGRIFKSSKNSQKLVKTLSKYHEKDIAEAITLLSRYLWLCCTILSGTDEINGGIQDSDQGSGL